MASGYFTSSYKEDMQIFRTIWIRTWMVILFVILAILPFFLKSHLIYLLNITGITIIAALGMNLITGFTGQVSLANAAFMGIGAYTSAILGNLGVPFWICLFSGGLLAAIISIVVAVPSLRLRGLYLIMSTMAFEVIIEYIFMEWETLTNGVTGIVIQQPRLGGFVFNTDLSMYYMILFFVILGIATATNIIRTKPGRAFIAIRDHDVAAKIIGINLTKYKVMAFFISSFYVGVAGGLYAYVVNRIDPEQFNMMGSIEYLIIIIIGGMGSITGTIFGSVFMVILPEFIRYILELNDVLRNFISVYFFDVKAAVFGLMIIIFLLGEPGGLVALWGKIKKYFRNVHSISLLLYFIRFFCVLCGLVFIYSDSCIFTFLRYTTCHQTWPSWCGRLPARQW